MKKFYWESKHTSGVIVAATMVALLYFGYVMFGFIGLLLLATILDD